MGAVVASLVLAVEEVPAEGVVLVVVVVDVCRLCPEGLRYQKAEQTTYRDS